MKARGFAPMALASLLAGCASPDRTHWDASQCPTSVAATTWAEAAPESTGLHGEPLEAISRRIEAGELGNIHSVLVVKDGKLVFERYFEGEDWIWGESIGQVQFDKDTLHDLRSVSKSVVGALVGVGLGEGMWPSLEAPLPDWLPSHGHLWPAERAPLRLVDALKMASGLAWDEHSHPYWDPRNDETAMSLREDPLAYVLSRDHVAVPGQVFSYNGGLPSLLGAAIESGSGRSLDQYAAEKLFCPLGIRHFEWVRYRGGFHVAASGLRMRPRDMARFGWMMLQSGRYQGEQRVPADFVESSLERQIATGLPGREGYGFQWWIHGGLPVAAGNGGQRIVLDRERNLMIVITAGDYDRPDQGAGPGAIIEAILRATGPVEPKSQ